MAFVLGFVLLGVGSGSTGLSDVFQNAFNFGSSNGTSIGSLQKKVSKQPQDATAWRDLATAYEQKQRTSDAVSALERYTALRPKDQNALGELASQYTTLVADVRHRLPVRPDGRLGCLAWHDLRAPGLDRRSARSSMTRTACRTRSGS